MVTAVQSCSLLRHSIQLLLPQHVKDLGRAIGKGLLKAPSHSSVSHCRLAVDVGFMFVMRALIERPLRMPCAVCLRAVAGSGASTGCSAKPTRSARVVCLFGLQAWGLAANCQKHDRLSQALEGHGLLQDHDREGPGGPGLAPYLESRDGRVVMPRLFHLALQVPGALFNNSLQELTSALNMYQEWFLPRLQAIANVFGEKHTSVSVLFLRLCVVARHPGLRRPSCNCS